MKSQRGSKRGLDLLRGSWVQLGFSWRSALSLMYSLTQLSVACVLCLMRPSKMFEESAWDLWHLKLKHTAVCSMVGV